ncbi:MAG: XdhC family protein, partial [Bacteroidetes bacterium]|nr:XdhC family protein [Bacteroidota bacterium]
FDPDRAPEKDFYFDKSSDDDWRYLEKTACKNQIFIIGGGHCGLALSRLMRSMDFYIRLYDTRPDLPTFLQNESAHEKIILPGYETLAEQIPSDAQHHYVVIMTLGYRTDDTALRALLHKDFKYLGLLGSKTKNDQLLSAFTAEGADPQRIARIHAPIGLAIHSQTPEEIAVSIAAQIIQVKNTIITFPHLS